MLVADAMIHRPKVLSVGVTVADVRRLFDDDHVHVALVVSRGRLLTVIQRDDLEAAAPGRDASRYGRLLGRVTNPEAELAPLHRRMLAERQRRLAVIDQAGRLLGLLCLKKTGAGFCSDKDVFDRSLAQAAHDGRRSIHVVLRRQTKASQVKEY